MRFTVIATNYVYQKVKKTIEARSAEYIRRNHLKYGFLDIESIEEVPTITTSSGRKIPSKIKPEHVEYWMLIDELTTDDLASMYKCCRQTICMRLKALNRDDVNERLRTRSQNFMKYTKFKNVEGRNLARELVLMGWKPDAIIHETRCGTKTVYDLVHELRELL